jgi:hypothetical protein
MKVGELSDYLKQHRDRSPYADLLWEELKLKQPRLQYPHTCERRYRSAWSDRVDISNR